MKFQLKESEIFYEFFSMNTPTGGNYIILESIESKIFFGFFNKFNYWRNYIWKREKNDVEIMNPFISRIYAMIKFVDGNIIIKNCSANMGHWFWLKKLIKINENKIQVQIRGTLIEARQMKFGEYDKLQLKNKKILSKKNNQ